MNRTTKSFAGLTGLALAVGAAYLFDPENGARRRSALGKQCKSTAERVNARTRVMGHDLSNRYHDASARVRTWFNPARRADDTLTKQVRMGLWREIPTSRNIGVFAHDGQVILHGHVPAHEHQRVLQVVASMQGVVGVADHLWENAEGMPQASGGRLRRSYDFMRDSLTEEHWSPPRRVCTGAAGLALLRFGVQHRNLTGTLTALAGTALILRSSTNLPWRRMAGKGKATVEELAKPPAGAARAGNKLSRAERWHESAPGA